MRGTEEGILQGKKGLSRVSEAIERVGRKIRGQVEGRGTRAEKV